MQTNAAIITSELRHPAVSLSDVTVELLRPGQEAEALRFLTQRPIHTVTLMSLINDNGLDSPLNRGKFYGCRDFNGHLEGVALIGHATLLETVSDRALQALAQIARECRSTHLIMGEQERMSEFWAYYVDAGHERRLSCREWLFELRWPIALNDQKPDLELATEEDLELVMPIQSELAFQESGIDPLKVDPVGFRQRCLRRIEQGRTWVLLENGSLIFKADVISQTDDVIYLEGIWVKDERRSDGSGVRCMSELAQTLLGSVRSICLLVNENNEQAQKFYRKCGFQFRATYETIFLPQKEEDAN